MKTICRKNHLTNKRPKEEPNCRQEVFGEYGGEINLIQCWLDHSSHKAELLLIQGHSTIRREQTHSFTRRQITTRHQDVQDTPLIKGRKMNASEILGSWECFV